MDISMEMVLASKGRDLSYNIQELNLFSLREKNQISKEVYINKKKNGDMVFSVFCNICEEYHLYNMPLKNLIKKNILVLGCNALGIPLIILGKKEDVENLVLHHNSVNYKLRAIF